MKQRYPTKLKPFIQSLKQRWILSVCSIMLYGVVSYLPLPGFTTNAHQVLAIFCMAAFLWITSALPLAVTGIVILFMLPLTGAVSAEKTYSYFGNYAVFFVLGAFILASPVMRSGLSTRVSVTIMSKFGRGPIRLLLTLFSLSGGLAFIISEHAVAAMLYPIVGEILNAAKVKPGSRFGVAAFLAMAWGAIIGGTATLLGGARAPLALGILESSTHMQISFLQWMTMTLPAIIPVFVVAFVFIYLIGRKSDVNIVAARAKLELHHSAMGKLSLREKLTIFVLGLTIILWITCGTSIGLDIIAFFGVILAFVLGITRWREIQEDVQWDIIIMYGSAIALGASLRDTGGASVIVNMVLNTGIHNPLFIFIAMILLAFILTEAMSNAAAVAVLLPIAIPLATKFGIDPRAIAVGVATTAGLTFMLPVSTPAMAIITNSAYVSPIKALKWGTPVKVIGFMIFCVIVNFYWPVLGIHLFRMESRSLI